MTKSNKYDAVVHIGGTERILSESKTIKAVFHNFAALPHSKGDVTSSPVIECHGYKWRISLFPGGDTDSEKDDYIAIFLECVSCSSSGVVKAAFNITIQPAASSSAGVLRKGTTGSMRFFMSSESNRGYDFAPRSDVLRPSNKYLVDGNLVVEVDIQTMIDKPPTWTPTNTLSLDMLKMLESNDPDDFDITFQVGSDGTKEFHAHRNILKVRAPVLADFVADYPDSSTDIPIKDVEPDVFRMLLRFIYGGEMPSDEVLNDQAKPIIHAADKYGCTGLKLSAESKMAAAGIDAENAAELVLFADATNCAMLKEAAMEYFVANAEDVLASEGYKQVAESPAILGEMVAAMAAGQKKRSAESDDNGRDFKRMRVATLRQKLDEKGLDVDGSKEMLVSRLEAAENSVVEVEQEEG